MSSTGQELPYSRQCATTRSMEWSKPSGGGNGGRRTSVVRRPIGSLPPAPRKVAPADSHRWSFLLQMDPQGPSSDLISALKKSPVQEHGCTLNGGFTMEARHLQIEAHLDASQLKHVHIYTLFWTIQQVSLELTCRTVLLGHDG